MKYLTEYRDAEKVAVLLEEIRSTVTRPWVIMEICGGQTHSIIRHGFDRLLPQSLNSSTGPAARSASPRWSLSTGRLPLLLNPM